MRRPPITQKLYMQPILISPLRMKVLISPKDEFEATEAVNGGAPVLVVNIKNPIEGSLEPTFLGLSRDFRDLVPHSIKLIATIGDFPHLPGSASLAALGAAVSGANYAKVGLKNTNPEMMQLFDTSLRIHKNGEGIRAADEGGYAGYADFRRASTLDPFFCCPT